MTPTMMIMTKEDLKGLGAPDLVYVREIRASDVLADAEVTTAPGFTIDPDSVLYAVHGADGERLAVMMDRETAFAAAVAHELEPVSVH
ncbi:DUF1150 family protein [Brevundimonas sp. NPDC092305]|uniref:DUF1150 family protein n=1 Tax=Brevundimonas sp. NPDC092305 TaxID=3363957 RepID=UPI00380A0927